MNTCSNCRWSWLSVIDHGDEPVLRCRPGSYEAAVQIAEIPCLEFEQSEYSSDATE